MEDYELALTVLLDLGNAVEVVDFADALAVGHAGGLAAGDVVEGLTPGDIDVVRTDVARRLVAGVDLPLLALGLLAELVDAATEGTLQPFGVVLEVPFGCLQAAGAELLTRLVRLRIELEGRIVKDLQLLAGGQELAERVLRLCRPLHEGLGTGGQFRLVLRLGDSADVQLLRVEEPGVAPVDGAVIRVDRCDIRPYEREGEPPPRLGLGHDRLGEQVGAVGAAAAVDVELLERVARMCREAHACEEWRLDVVRALDRQAIGNRMRVDDPPWSGRQRPLDVVPLLLR